MLSCNLHPHPFIPSPSFSLSFCHPVILSFCHPVIMSLSSCHPVILSSCHPVILSSCHYVILSFCLSVILSFCHFVMSSFLLASCHPVNFSCHPVILSCHPVILTSFLKIFNVASDGHTNGHTTSGSTGLLRRQQHNIDWRRIKSGFYFTFTLS